MITSITNTAQARRRSANLALLEKKKNSEWRADRQSGKVKEGNIPGALMSVRLGDALLSSGPMRSPPSPKLSFLAAGGAAITSSLLGSETLP